MPSVSLSSRFLSLVLAATLLEIPLPAAAAPGGSGVPAELTGEWISGPVVDPKGTFLYCVAESRTTGGQALVLGRSARDELNIAIGMPGAGMTRGQGWPVKVVVDSELRRNRQALAAEPELLVIANGPDQELLEAIGHGQLLTIEGPHDSLAFRLKGSGKAVRDLRACTDNARAGKPGKPLGRIDPAGAPATLPPGVREILAQAGFKKIDLLPLSAAPAGLSPVQAVWRVGPVTAGISETLAAADNTLPTLSEQVANRLRPACGEDFDIRWKEPELLPGAALREAVIGCKPGGKEPLKLALLFYLTRTGLFTTLFHQTPAREAAAGSRDHDAVTTVIRKAAAVPPARGDSGH
ncbi:putative Signal peptide protein [Azospirillaceae bacterium]